MKSIFAVLYVSLNDEPYTLLLYGSFFTFLSETIHDGDMVTLHH